MAVNDVCAERSGFAPGAVTTVKAWMTKLNRKNLTTSNQSAVLQTVSPFLASEIFTGVLKCIVGIDEGRSVVETN